MAAPHLERCRSKRRRSFEEYDFHEEYVDYDMDLGGYDEYDDYVSLPVLPYRGELYRDVVYGGPKKVIRNPRDSRFFPGNVPAGIMGLTPKLMDFITMHVNQVSFYVQGPPPEGEDYP